MKQLTKNQVDLLNEMIQNDEKFRNLIEGHLQRKMIQAEKSYYELRNVVDTFNFSDNNKSLNRKSKNRSKSSDIDSAPASKRPQENKRPQETKGLVKSHVNKAKSKSKKRANTKTSAVLSAIGSHNKGISAGDLESYLKQQKVDIKRSMLNSYLFQLKKRGDIVVDGTRGSYVYSIAR